MNTITQGGVQAAKGGVVPISKKRAGSTPTTTRTFYSEKAHKTASVMNDSVKAKSTPEFKKVNEALTDKSRKLNDSLHDLAFTVINMKADDFDKKAPTHADTIRAHLAKEENAHLLEVEELKKLNDHTAKDKPEELAKLQDSVFALVEKYEEDMKGIKAKSGNSTDGDRTAEYVEKVLKETLENIKKFNPDYTSNVPDTQTPEQRIKALEDALKAIKDKKLGILEYSGIAGLIAALGMSIASIASLGNMKNQMAKMQQAMQANTVNIGQALTAVYNSSQQQIAALNEQISQLLNILNDAQDATMTLIKNIAGRQPQVAQAMHSAKTTAKKMNAGEQTATTAEPPGATNANAERIAAAAKKQAEITAAARNAIPQATTPPAGPIGAVVPTALPASGERVSTNTITEFNRTRPPGVIVIGDKNNSGVGV